jgi:hypothetical protein
MKRKRRLTDKEIMQRRRFFLEEVAKASGLSLKEIEQRWEDFLNRSRIDIKKAEGAGLRALRRIEKRKQLKVTASLNPALAKKFKFVKNKMGSKSNSQLIKQLIIDAYERIKNSVD